jgi:hypothetical protein
MLMAKLVKRLEDWLIHISLNAKSTSRAPNPKGLKMADEADALKFIELASKFLPPPYGPALQAALDIIMTAIARGDDPAEEIRRIHKEYSDRMQQLANKLYGG